MSYRHNAVIGTDWNLVFWNNSLCVSKKIESIIVENAIYIHVYIILKVQIFLSFFFLKEYYSFVNIYILHYVYCS